jgi:hypothetical protein
MSGKRDVQALHSLISNAANKAMAEHDKHGQDLEVPSLDSTISHPLDTVEDPRMSLNVEKQSEFWRVHVNNFARRWRPPALMVANVCTNLAYGVDLYDTNDSAGKISIGSNQAR